MKWFHTGSFYSHNIIWLEHLGLVIVSSFLSEISDGLFMQKSILTWMVKNSNVMIPPSEKIGK